MRSMLDLVDRLRAYTGNDPSAQKSAAVLRAATQAVKEISTRTAWNFYRTQARITTSASYDTGTVEYDYTGGANERQVTLTGGVLPEWVAGYGTLNVNNVPYEIERRISNTVCTLRADSCPTSDIAAGTDYTIYRTRYDLPADFDSICRPILTGQNMTLYYVQFSEFLRQSNLNSGVGQPRFFTIYLNQANGRNQILLWNPPDSDNYSFVYEYYRHPVQPLVVDASQGTVSLTSGSLSVTGTQTLFQRGMANAVLRVSFDATKPTAFDSVSPPQFEYLIDQYVSSTSLTLLEPATETVSKRGYTISSRVDVRDGPMFDFLCQIGYRMLRMALRINMIDGELAEYQRSEATAKSQDGQLYGDSDVASVPQVAVMGGRGYGGRGSFMVNRLGNG